MPVRGDGLDRLPAQSGQRLRQPVRIPILLGPYWLRVDQPPIVLIRGDATVADMVRDEGDELGAPIFKESVRRQPSARQYVGNPIARSLFLFYFQRSGLAAPDRH